jgi:hypothetical protein
VKERVIKLLKVKYIGKLDFFDALITGKTYNVIKETDVHYVLTNELGENSAMHKSKFEIQ